MSQHPGPRILVRRPAATLAAGLVMGERRVVDVGVARRQWADYVAAFLAAGWSVVPVPTADDLADSVFVEDPVAVFGDLAVITHPGAPSRRPETETVGPLVRDLGFEVARIEDPGTLEGGDVLKIGRDVYVGTGGRTNEDAVAQLRTLLVPRGWRVTGIPLQGVLHLKSAITALPDGTVLAAGEFSSAPLPFDRLLTVPEPEGAHVVLLGGDRLLMSASAPQSVALLEARGFTVVPVEIGEFEKLDGCVTCLSVRLRG